MANPTDGATRLVASIWTLPGITPLAHAVARRQPETHLWSFDFLDGAAVPNARVALALMLCIRRLPGAFPDHDHDDLGALLGPVVEQHSALARRLVSAHIKTRLAVGDDVCTPSTLGPSMLHERHIQSLIGESFARSYPKFRPLFDKVQKSLQTFLAKNSFAADRNIEMLVRLVKMPPPEEALMRLAAAFCYSSIKRSLFAFVDSPSRIVNAVEQLCSIRGNATIRLFDGDGVLARSCLLEALNNRRQRVDLEDLLKLSAAGECLLAPHSTTRPRWPRPS